MYGGAQLAVNVTCSSPCSGNGFTDCGGPNLLSIYNSTKSTNKTLGSFTPAVKQSVNFTGTSWTYQGCYMEPNEGRALTGFSYSDTLKMTVESCLGNCNALNYTYGGLEYASECVSPGNGSRGAMCVR